MTWVKFTEKDPPIGFPVLIRIEPLEGAGSMFREWLAGNIEDINPLMTHWWDGDLDVRYALMCWELLEDKDWLLDEEN